MTTVSSGLTGWAASRVPVTVIFGVIAVAAALCSPAATLRRKFWEA